MMRKVKARKIKKTLIYIRKAMLIICLFGLTSFVVIKINQGNAKDDDIFYPVIKQDTNENYDGLGQEGIKGKDGYFTTFTTAHERTFLEYKQNDGSWKDNEYWGGTMEDNGCGIVALATLLSGYNQNYTPEDLRQKYYPKMDYDYLSNELAFEFGISNSDFMYDENSLSENAILNHLKQEMPILVCVWDNVANRWTKESHYLLLLAADQNGMVYVSNPNGLENTSKSSGWYDISEVSPYIAKILYIYE